MLKMTSNFKNFLIILLIVNVASPCVARVFEQFEQFVITYWVLFTMGNLVILPLFGFLYPLVAFHGVDPYHD